MQTIELERAAYIANNPQAALLARIADLERKIKLYESTLDVIATNGKALSGEQCALIAYDAL